MDWPSSIGYRIYLPGDSADFNDSKMIENIESYRESFGLELPPTGTVVEIDYMDGSQYSIIWPDCPDGESILYMWLKSKIHARSLCEKHGWIVE